MSRLAGHHPYSLGNSSGHTRARVGRVVHRVTLTPAVWPVPNRSTQAGGEVAAGAIK